MKYIKARLTLPGRIQARAWAHNQSMSTTYPSRFYYKIIKEHVIKWALEQPEEMGPDLVMKMDDDGAYYEINVKRKEAKIKK